MKFFGFIVLLLTLVAGAYFISQNEAHRSGEDNAQRGSAGRTLDVRNRALTRVPEDVFAETGITTLDLSGNQLDGALPAEIRNLRELKILDLSDNQFTGVPAEIGQLSELVVLDLSNNEITGLPLELGNLSNLKSLDLSGNPFSETDLSKIREKLPRTTVIKTQ